ERAHRLIAARDPHVPDFHHLIADDAGPALCVVTGHDAANPAGRPGPGTGAPRWGLCGLGGRAPNQTVDGRHRERRSAEHQTLERCATSRRLAVGHRMASGNSTAELAESAEKTSQRALRVLR